MRVLLFDMHVDGHHLEVASGVLRALESSGTDLSVDFLAAEPFERHDTYFESAAVDFLFEESGVLDRLSTDPVAAREEVFDALGEYVRDRRRDYDVVHLLQVDDVLREVCREFGDRSGDLPALCGTVDGFFFNDYMRLNHRTKAVLRRAPARACLGAVPDRLLDRAFRDSRTVVPRNVHLARALRRGVFDHLFVRSAGAATYLRDLVPGAETDVSVVPNPVTPVETAVSKTRARERLGIPAHEAVLLFFGEMRREKGVEFLLRAVEQYDGPPFTLVLAGKPVDVDGADIDAAARGSAVRIHRETGFVPAGDVPDYFAAADCVVVPYLRYFGAERTSGVFQKACTAGRPVIGADFGTLARRIREHDLGLTFEPESESALCAAIERWLTAEEPVYDPDRMRAYAESQGFDTVAARYREAYGEQRRRPPRAHA